MMLLPKKIVYDALHVLHDAGIGMDDSASRCGCFSQLYPESTLKAIVADRMVSLRGVKVARMDRRRYLIRVQHSGKTEMKVIQTVRSGVYHATGETLDSTNPANIEISGYLGLHSA